MPLTVEQARLLIPCKKDFYSAMLRNHYVMPAYTERLVTTAWMLGVIRGTHWCLTSGEVNCLHQCAKRPSKKVMARILVTVMLNITEPAEKVAGIKATAELILEHPPDLFWMLTCLAQMDSNHEVFGRDYVPPKPQKDFEAYIDVPNLDDLQGFFAGLPLSTNQQGRRCIDFRDPAVKLQVKKAKLDARVKRAVKAVEDEKKRQEERAAKLATKLAAKKAEAEAEAAALARSSAANPLDSSRRDSNVAAGQQSQSQPANNFNNHENHMNLGPQMVAQVQINTMMNRGNDYVQSQEAAGSGEAQQVVIDPATGQPVPMAAYDEQSMHVDQTQLVGPGATGPNIIQNREDFEGVDAEPRSHDFQTHQVFGDIT